MTPALSLYLLAAARAEPIMVRRARRVLAREAAGPRPTGEVVWLHLAGGQPPDSATTLASRISDERPRAHFVLTSDEPLDADGGLARLTRPVDYPRAVDAFLSIWKPNAAVWIGGPIWPVLAAKARQAGVPMILANATADQATSHRGIPARDLLGLFDTIVACEARGGTALERASRRRVAVGGPLQRSSPALDHDEGEYRHLSEALQTRPVWYAAAATEPELDALYDAHAVGQGASHRLLLILQPAELDAAWPGLSQYGVRRSTHGVPPLGAAVLVADLPGEEGLWFRLASVSFVGGTLGGPGSMVDPFAPAALGSAILHGPTVRPYEAHFRALGDAGATRQVDDAVALGHAVADLLAPDRAAILASKAWAVISDGAEATDHVVEEVVRLLDAGR